MLHLVYGMNSSLISASLVRHSLLLFLLSHMAVHHLHHLHISPLASSLTRSVFHSELKNWLFSKSFPPLTFSFLTGLIPLILGPFSVFTLLNGWICLHGVLD